MNAVESHSGGFHVAGEMRQLSRRKPEVSEAGRLKRRLRCGKGVHGRGASQHWSPFAGTKRRRPDSVSTSLVSLRGDGWKPQKLAELLERLGHLGFVDLGNRPGRARETQKGR